MKKYFCALLLCSVCTTTQPFVPAALFAKSATSILAATAAAGAGIMTLAVAGTTAAIGEADQLREQAGQKSEITLSDIAHGWARQIRRTQRGFNVAYDSLGKALKDAPAESPNELLDQDLASLKNN